MALRFKSVASLRASKHDRRGIGAVWFAGEFAYKEASPTATDHHIKTKGGVKLYVQPSPGGGYNVLAFDADPTGVNDSVRAFRKARNAAGDEGLVYVPNGAYRLSGWINLDTYLPSFIGEGFNTVLNFESGGFYRGDVGGAGGWRGARIENFYINTLSDDFAIEIRDTVLGFSLRNIVAVGTNGICMEYNNDWRADNIACRDSGGGTGVGFYAGSQGILTGYNCHGKGVGLRMSGGSIVAIKGRIEECDVGIQLGGGPQGTALNNLVEGFTTEACGIGLDIVQATNSVVRATQHLGYENNTYNVGIHGIRIRSFQYCTLDNVRALGHYEKSGLDWQLDSAIGGLFKGVLVGNNKTDGVKWDMRGAIPRIIECEMPGFDPDNIVRTGSVAVGAGVTPVSVPFPNIADEGSVKIASVAHLHGAAPVDTYDYAVASIDAMGIFGDLGRFEAEFTNGQGGARVHFNQDGDGLLGRRLYRKLATEDWDDGWFGYWDIPIPATSFDDTGQAFDGYAGPPENGANRPTYSGPDENYEVALTPEFQAMVSVVPGSKTDNGFEVDLSAGHPGGTLNWILMRERDPVSVTGIN